MEPTENISYYTARFTLRPGVPTIIQLPQVSHDPTPSLVRLDTDTINDASQTSPSANLELHATPKVQRASNKNSDERGASANRE